MFASAIVRAFRPTTLQVLCAVGFLHGISLFIYTIRQRRRPALTNTFANKQPLNRDSIADQTARSSSVHVIRLSPRTDAVNVSTMTQQQKIAAALIKAGSIKSESFTTGSSNSSWYDSELHDSESKSPVQVAIATPSTVAGEGNGRIPPHLGALTPLGWKIYLMFTMSAVLTFLSLYFFLESLR